MDGATLDKLVHLFRGAPDRVGQLHHEGRYQSLQDDTEQWVRLHFTDPRSPAAGVYPYLADWSSAAWGCIDIDHGDKGIDGLPIARNVVRTADLLNLHGHIEKTKSPMCYHVWFFSDPVPAADWRDALLAINAVSGADSKEVNPKQSERTALNIGNFVNLPYPAKRYETGRYMCDMDGRPLDPDTFVSQVKLTASDQVTRAAAIWRKHQERTAPSPIRYEAPLPGARTSLTEQLNGKAWRIYNEGPYEDGDRSGALYRLAAHARDSGLAPGEVFALVKDADARWGKFHGRSDCDRQIDRLVQKVYGH